MRFELKDLVKISEVEEKYNIPRQTLHSRLKNLIENIDYRKFGKKSNIIVLTPDGVEKLVNSGRND